MLEVPVKPKKRAPALIALGVLVLAVVLFLYIIEPVRVDGRSMAETLEHNELLWVSKIDYVLREPERFDVVICHYPDREGKQFVKRLVGLPGDTVEVRNAILYLNGSPVIESYILYPANYYYAPYTLKKDEYFVLGDNRANSNDSHLIGPLHRSQILGRVLNVFYPFTQARGIE